MDDNTKPSEVVAELRARAEKLRTGTNDQHTPAACENGADTIERLQALAGEMAAALAKSEGIQSGPNGRGGMRVCVHFSTPGDELALFSALQSYQEINK